MCHYCINFCSDPEESLEDEDDDLDMTDSNVTIASITAGQCRIIYSHPEALLSSGSGKAMVKSNKFREKICLVAIDEAHMIYEWLT